MREGWEYKKLGEVVSFFRGLTYSGKDEVSFSNNVVLRSNNIDLSTNTINFDELKFISDSIIIPKDKKIKKNSIFMCMSNGSEKHLGKVAFIDKEYPYAFGGFMGLIVPKEKELIPKMTYYYFCSQKFKAYISSIGNGANINNIKFVDIAKDTIPLPPKSTQLAIVSELDKINELIRLKKEQLKDFDNLAQSIFYEMFGDPVENEMGWEVKKLGDVCTDIKYGTSKPATENGRYTYLRMCNLTTGGFLDLSNTKQIDIPDDEIEKCIVRYGDILFNRTNSIDLVGKTCMFDQKEPMVIAGYIIRVRLNDTLLPVVLTRMFNITSIKKLLRSMAKGAVNQANINSKELASIRIPLPPLTLQQLFAQRIEQIEHQKAEVQKSITDLETLLASRMQYWFE